MSSGGLALIESRTLAAEKPTRQTARSTFAAYARLVTHAVGSRSRVATGRARSVTLVGRLARFGS
jgi:hypothetical protein